MEQEFRRRVEEYGDESDDVRTLGSDVKTNILTVSTRAPVVDCLLEISV